MPAGATSGTSRKLRLLCLHGFSQNGTIFKNKTGSLRKAVKSRAECIFVDAPYIIDGDSTMLAGAGQNSSDIGSTSPLSWWYLGGNAKYPSDTDNYSGFALTYENLVKQLKVHQPIDGLLGFSQGASTIGLLLSRMVRSDSDSEREMASNIKCAVLVGGFLPKHAGWAAEVKGALPRIRSLHVCGETDRMVSLERSDALKSAFATNAGEEITDTYTHPGGHMVPTCTGDFRDRLRNFLDTIIDCK